MMSSDHQGQGNRRQILKSILLHQPISRTAIAQQTGLTGASVSRITRDLIDAGIVRESDEAQPNTGPGRRFVSLEIDPDGGYLLGLSLNVFQQQITLTDLRNRLVEKVDLKFKDLSDPDAVIDSVISAMATLSQQCRRNDWHLIGGAIAITGAIDPGTGVVRYAPVLEWRDVALGSRLEAALGVPFVVESLPNTLNLAETRFGVATDSRNVLLINCALGIGASLHLDGRLIRSTDFTAGLAGSVRFPFCDREGAVSLDDVTAGRAVIAGVNGVDPGSLKMPADEMAARLLEILHAAERAEGVEREWVRKTGQTLGNVVSLYAGLIHPKKIIFNGPLGGARIYFEAAKAALESLCCADCIMPELISSEMSYQAAARWLAIHQHLLERDWEGRRSATGAMA